MGERITSFAGESALAPRALARMLDRLIAELTIVNRPRAGAAIRVRRHMKFMSRVLPLFLLAGVACSSTEAAKGAATDPKQPGSAPAPAPGPAPTSDAGSPDSPGKSANGALEIVSLTATTTRLTGGTPGPTETDSVTFVAIVTNKSGLDNIAGGQLLDDVGTTYGSFGTGSTKGTYTSTVTWKQINEGREIELSAPGGQRTFVAKFFDNDGNVATAPLPIALQCRLDAAKLVDVCNGICTDTSSSLGDHCGSCKACDKGMLCVSSTCVPSPFTSEFTQCVSVRSVAAGTTCNDVCSKSKAGSCRAAYANTTPTCAPSADQGEECTTDLRNGHRHLVLSMRVRPVAKFVRGARVRRRGSSRASLRAFSSSTCNR